MAAAAMMRAPCLIAMKATSPEGKAVLTISSLSLMREVRSSLQPDSMERERVTAARRRGRSSMEAASMV
jgi:hypothetical protein